MSLAVTLALGWPGSSSGQGAATATQPAPAAQAEAVPLAPVVIDGETLVSVRGVTSFPAERRAREAEARIRAIAKDRDRPSPSLTLEDGPNLTIVSDDRRLRVMVALDDDAAIENVDRRVLAHTYRNRIAEAIAAYRAARQPTPLAWHALYALGGTLALVLAALGGRGIVRDLQARLERRYRARLHDLKFQTFHIVKAEQLWRFLSGALRFVWGAAPCTARAAAAACRTRLKLTSSAARIVGAR